MSVDHLIHANTHRAKEGARVLEDFARFILRDELLFKEMRKLRHDLQTIPPTDIRYIDLGGPSLVENNYRSNFIQLVHANALRVQEALRVLEEFTPNQLQKQKMKTLRFEAYYLHQAFYKKTISYIKQDKLKGLYLVIDMDLIHLSLNEITAIINKSSAQIVQLRSKSLAKRAFLKQAVEFKDLLNPNILLIINDHVDIALDLADGVHLGQEDYPLNRARKIVPEHFIIGATCHSVEEAQIAEQAGANYLTVGCLFPTKSKKDVTMTSLTELGNIRKSTSLPLSVIGGIAEANLPAVLPYRVEMVAVISTIWNNSDPFSIIEKMTDQILSARSFSFL